MKKKKGVMQSTFQTRLVVKGAEKEFLSVWAAEYARIQRCLFQQLYPRKSGSLPHNKPAFMGTHDLSSRQYNAVRRDLDGKTRSYLSNLDNRIIQAEIQVKAAAAKIGASVKKLEKLSAKTDPRSRSRTSIIKKALFQKRRRRARLNTKLADLNQIKAAGRPSICFGSRKLFKEQFNLVANGIACHKDWKIKWQRARRNQFFVVGSKDETAGNLSCQLSESSDGTFTLTIRVPPCLVKQFGDPVQIKHITFKHGHELVAAALAENALRRTKRNEYRAEKRRLAKQGKKPGQTEARALQDYGVAMSYRFVYKNARWYVMLTTEEPLANIVTHKNAGMVGVDVNVDHLAVTEVNRYGGPVTFWTVPLRLHGKTTGQRKALILEQVSRIVAYALAVKKPVGIETLDFKSKKQRLFYENKKAALKLSAFAYALILTGIERRCHRSGVACVTVNPAYTSLLGKIKYQKRHGMSAHHAAAFVIARKGMGFSDPLKSRKYHHFFEGTFYTRQLPEEALAGSLASVLKKVGKYYRGAYSKLHRQSQKALDPARAGPVCLAET